MKRTPSVGFTLIELLIVVAVIGVLAALVLVAAASARNKAQDSRIHTDIGQMRRLSEDYFNSNGTSYTGLNTCAATPTAANCAGSQSIADSVATLKADILKANGIANSLVVSAGATSFCLYANLISVPAQAVCSDSSGRTSTITASAGCTVTGSGPATLYTCP